MANNLLAKGYPLVVYDVIESCVEGAVKNGAVKASSPAEVTIHTVYRFSIVTMIQTNNVHLTEIHKLDLEVQFKHLILFFTLQVASQTKTVITMLPAADFVIDCYTGDNGILR